MTKIEKTNFHKWARALSDAQLERKYYDCVFDSLGDVTEEMYEQGYDLADIHEEEKCKADIIEMTHILEHLCVERGIKLWEE